MLGDFGQITELAFARSTDCAATAMAGVPAKVMEARYSALHEGRTG
jgi:hypothetical protein